MRRNSWSIVGFLICVQLLIHQKSRSDETNLQKGDVAPVDELIHDVLAASSPYDLAPASGRLFRKLFEAIGNEGLVKLQHHAHNTIAIQAAWHRVVGGIPQEEQEETIRLDRDKLNWFVGFLEGRARVKPPEWWVTMLLDARAKKRGSVHTGWFDEHPRDYYGIDETLPNGPHSITSRKGGKVIIRLGDETLEISESLLWEPTVRQPGYRETALMTASRCYVATHESTGMGYKLVCIARSSGKVLWRSDVWSTTWYGPGGNRMTSWIEIAEQNDKVVVFGSAWTGLHVEAFAVDDGATLFRFSTAY